MSSSQSIKSTAGLTAAIVLGVACGPVGKSDPDFWEPAKDVGGTQYDLAGPGAAVGGASSYAGAQGYGGGYVPPPGSGGFQSFGGSNPFGSGGSSNPFGSGGSSNPFGSGGSSNPFGSGGGSPVGAGGAPPPPPPGSGPCNFTFTVTTVTARGRYSPNNVGALWIEDAGGKFVASLEVWGGIRLGNLTAYTSVNGNAVDAVTSGTLSSHRQHTRTWDCHVPGQGGTYVPNGNYQACVSFAEDDAIPFFGPAPHVQCYPIQIGAGPQTSNPPSVANFTGWTLSMQ